MHIVHCFKPSRSAAWLLVLTVALVVGLGSSEETLGPDAVNKTWQMLVDGQARTYTLVEPGFNCSGYSGQFCCDDTTTKACAVQATDKACRNGTTTFCISIGGEVQLPQGPYPIYVKSMRLIDTTGTVYTREECVFRGTGPRSQCSVDNLNKAEIQCCTGRDAHACLPWSDNRPCPMSHPASFCRVCSISKFTPLEIGTLALAGTAALCALVQALSSYSQSKWARKAYEYKLQRDAQRDQDAASAAAGANNTGNSSQPGQPVNPAPTGSAASTTSASEAPVVIKLLRPPQAGASQDNPESQALLVTFRPHSGGSGNSSRPGSAGAGSSGEYSAYSVDNA